MMRRSVWRRFRRAALSSALIVLALSSAQDLLNFGAQATAQAAALNAAAVAGRVSHHPNTLAEFLAARDAAGQAHAHLVYRAPQVAGPQVFGGKGPNQMVASAGKPMTHPITISLDASLLASAQVADGPGAAARARAAESQPGTNAPVWFKSQEGILELGLVPGSVDISRATVAVGAQGAAAGPGTSSGQVSVAPSGPLTLQFAQTEGGYSGESLQVARFTLSVLDDKGRTLQGVQLRAPITLRLHYLPPELAGLNPTSLLLAWPATGSIAQKIVAQAVPVTVDTKAHTLNATVPTLYPGPAVLTGTPSDASQASIEHLTMNGNQGDLSFTVPLDVPPAAGGLMPDLQLVYSSAGPNGRHDRKSPATWVGDGWSLNLGSISYDASTGLYYLNGVGGVSEPLLCCMVDESGMHMFVPQHHPQLRVYTDNYNQTPNTSGVSFHLQTPDGVQYDFSPTITTVNGSTLNYVEWDVTTVTRRGPTTDPALQQYTVSYWKDTASSNGVNYVRDAGIKEIDYNYVNGQPQAKIYFDIHWPDGAVSGSSTAATYGNNWNCASAPTQTTTLRCDDPVTPSGWEQAPLNISTLTLDHVKMFVQQSGTWHQVRQYNLTYNPDDPWTMCWDQFNGQNFACSGEHTLASVQEIPYQVVSGADTAMPSLQPIQFTYTYFHKNEYHDTTELAANGQPYDAQTWWRYLSGFTDPQTGASEGVAWVTGYGNTHLAQTDPTYCDSHSCTFPGVDDRQWPRQLVYSITDTAATPNTTTYFAYTLNQACGSGCTQDTWIPPNAWNACSGPQGPGNPNPSCLENSWLNFYNEDFTGFSEVTTTHGDGSSTVVQYYAGDGWGTGDWDIHNVYKGHPIVTDTYQGSPSGTPLVEVRDSYLNNFCPKVSDSFDQLYQNPYMFCLQLETQRDTYLGGTSGSSPAVPHLTQTWTYDTSGGGRNSSGVLVDHFYLPLNASAMTGNDLLADSFTTSGYGSTQPTFTSNFLYTFHDGMLDSPQSGFYLVDHLAQATLSDSASTQWSCSQISYDGLTWNGSTTPYSNSANSPALAYGLPTRTDAFSDGVCGSSSHITTGAGYDSYGQSLVTTDADALASISGHTGCSATPVVVYPTGASSYTTCTAYDSGQQAYPTSATNAKNQTTSTSWDVLQGVPSSSTDANNVTTTYAGPVYEYNGAVSLANYRDIYAQMTLPGETYTDGSSSPWTTRVFSYSFCNGTSGTTPCVETDTVRQLDGINLAVSRSFYDREGRLVETRTLGPTPGMDTVTITSYADASNPGQVFQSVPCQVPTLSMSTGGTTSSSTPGYIAPTKSGNGSSAYVDPTASGPCQNPTGTTTYYDELGRVVASNDPLGTGTDSQGTTNGTGCALALDGGHHHTSCAVYTTVVASSTSGLPTTDGEPYLQTLTVDGDLHQQATYTDAWGRTAYAQRFTGGGQTPGSGISSYAVSSYQYDPLGKLRQVTDAQGNLTTFTYDAVGRMTASSDPDLGSWTYTYDANGNVLQQTDARGATGNPATTGRVNLTYDGLNRLLSVTPDGGTTPYACYVYDGGGGSSCPSVPGLSACPSGSGTNLVGRLCQETFASGPNQQVTGGYDYAYDQRGRTTSTTFSIQGPSFAQTAYTLAPTYDDADRTATLAYPTLPGLTPETLSFGYNNAAGGVLSSLSSTVTSPTSVLFVNPTYNAQGLLTSWQSGMGSYQATLSQSYDGDLRLADRKLTSTPNGGSATTVAEVQPTYDAAGNVATLTTTLGPVGSSAGGTEKQVFSYDEQNRLVSGGTQSNPYCAINGGSEGIASAGYTACYQYDTLGRITTGGVANGSQSVLPNTAAGTYTYDPTHVHEVVKITGFGSDYSAAYDSAGDMTCRSVGSSTACGGSTPTGELLGYNALRQMIQWQSAATSATPATDTYAYDGSGRRVWQQVVQQNINGTTTTSTWIYVLGVAEQRTFFTTGQSSTSTGHEYLPTPGGVLTIRDTTSGLNFDVTDLLGTPIANLNLASGAQGESLDAPYGQNRYTANASGPGGMNTAKGFTGQYVDASMPGSSGLDYFNARYYDPTIGRFTSADTAHPGLGNPLGLDNYNYVNGQVETLTDPSGHWPHAWIQWPRSRLAKANLLANLIMFLLGSDTGRGDKINPFQSPGIESPQPVMVAQPLSYPPNWLQILVDETTGNLDPYGGNKSNGAFDIAGDPPIPVVHSGDGEGNGGNTGAAGSSSPTSPPQAGGNGSGSGNPTGSSGSSTGTMDTSACGDEECTLAAYLQRRLTPITEQSPYAPYEATLKPSLQRLLPVLLQPTYACGDDGECALAPYLQRRLGPIANQEPANRDPCYYRCTGGLPDRDSIWNAGGGGQPEEIPEGGDDFHDM